MNPVEEWKPVLRYEGLYEVSSLGRVKSLRFGRLLTSNSRNRDGYPVVSLSRAGTAKMVLVHTLVAEAFIGPRPPGQVVCHHDDVPDHNAVSNLRWGTQSENAFDKVRNGRHHMTSRTHCPLNHALSGENLVSSHPGRKCRACASARAFSHHRSIPFTQELADSYYERYRE